MVEGLFFSRGGKMIGKVGGRGGKRERRKDSGRVE